jgi:hypothetical protein
MTARVVPAVQLVGMDLGGVQMDWKGDASVR